jgi:hypothetical protein
MSALRSRVYTKNNITKKLNIGEPDFVLSSVQKNVYTQVAI